jgi:hypothetical protein
MSGSNKLAILTPCECGDVDLDYLPHRQLCVLLQAEDTSLQWFSVRDVTKLRTIESGAVFVENLVFCEGHGMSPANHCYHHGDLYCRDPSCGPCIGPIYTLTKS